MHLKTKRNITVINHYKLFIEFYLFSIDNFIVEIPYELGNIIYFLNTLATHTFDTLKHFSIIKSQIHKFYQQKLVDVLFSCRF